MNVLNTTELYVHLEMVKIVSVMLHTFYHNKKKVGGKVEKQLRGIPL